MSGTNIVLLRSTDAGAPILSGSAGSLITLLDACLINGYNSKSITSITRNGTTATATCAGHGFATDGLTKVRIAGADQSAYNGDFTIFNVTANTFDFTVSGSPITPATGTITAKVAPLDWGKPFSGTNKGVYRSSEVTGSRLYLRVDDNNPLTNDTRVACARGYEAMSDVDTGTGLFPTAAQIATGIYFNKSDSATTAARSWVIVGDGFEFFFFYANNASYAAYRTFHFGDPAPEMASDPYGCLIYGDYASNPGSTVETGSYAASIVTTPYFGLMPGHYYARLYSQIGTSAPAGKFGNFTAGSPTFGQGLMAYPAPHNNGLYVSPIFANDSSVIRSQLKGIWQPLHTRPLGNGSVLSAANSPIGRRLYAIATPYSSTNYGETHIDIDGPWR